MIESVQYNAALEITGAIKGSSREQLYQELRLERLIDRRWYRRLVQFYKIITSNSPKYLHVFYQTTNSSMILEEVSYSENL